jgi:hypothetical protein
MVLRTDNRGVTHKKLNHLEEDAAMSRLRFCLPAIVFGVIMTAGVAIAQTPGSPAPDSSKPSVTERVETWTKKHWEAAKREWAKDKVKWADCRAQSKQQKLKGRKSWSFLYSCMTK